MISRAIEVLPPDCLSIPYQDARPQCPAPAHGSDAAARAVREHRAGMAPVGTKEVTRVMGFQATNPCLFNSKKKKKGFDLLLFIEHCTPVLGEVSENGYLK